jgi:geranylgeranyl pyrophosphate synthase
VAVSLDQERERINRGLEAVAESGLDGVPESLREPVRYAIAGEGKRLRPLLTILVYSAVGGGGGDIAPLAVAVELIHTYSLVHDDLPCMDDDDFRRGRPTVHKQFDARRAILAGAALIPIAARTVFRAGRDLGFDDAKCAALAAILLEAGGAGGMIGGQLLDLSSEGRSLSLEEQESLHRAKTGALILAAVKIGAVAACAPADDLAAFDIFGRSLGLAFQILDDVSDVTQTSAAMGKTTGRDTILGKSTYPALLGVDQARRRAEELIKDGTGALSARGLLTANLSEVANLMLARKA